MRLLLGFFILLVPALTHGSILIVDNNQVVPGGSNHYTTLAAAVSAAVDGDTIYIVPGPVSYGNLTITKQLVFFGGGFNPFGENKARSVVDNVNFHGTPASYSSVYSLYILNNVLINSSSISGNIYGLGIYNCYIDKKIEAYNRIADILSITIRGNILGDNAGSVAAINLLSTVELPYIQNNVILGSSSPSYGSIHIPNLNYDYGAYIESNIFLGNGGSYAFRNLSNATIEKNIFYGRAPESSDSTNFFDNHFFANISYNTLQDFSIGTVFNVRNIDDGDNYTIDPQFINLPITDIWSMNYDIHVQAAEALNFTPYIGVYAGGSKGNESFDPGGGILPSIYSIRGLSSILEGEDLNLQLVLNSSPKNILGAEYFIDGPDPGMGSATDLGIVGPIPSPDTSSHIFNTSGLSPGFHNLYVRIKLDTGQSGMWGYYEGYPFFIEDLLTNSGSEIQKVEYFFDDDPGYGNATSFTITQGNIVDIVDAIPTSELTNGFHTLYLRAENELGVWGLPEGKLIYVDHSQGDTASHISNIEYFFDDDPGYGLGMPVTVNTPASVVDIMDAIPTTSLTTGFHTLYIRAKNSKDAWGVPEARLIYVDPSQGDSAAHITALEYFFDDDPGHGFATSIPVTSPASIVDVMDAIPTEGLTIGFHTLFVRAKNSNNTWGLPENRLIYIDNAGTAGNSPIKLIEYFVDNDPGYGNATQIPIGTPEKAVEVSWNINENDLGIHVFGIRALTEDNTWSITEKFLFTVFEEGRELDSAALVEIYEKNGGFDWNIKTNWVSTNPINTWFGVSVDSTGRVKGLNLSDNNLTGDLAREFAYLLDLETADLSENNLTDTIPAATINLVNLQMLDLSKNGLNGLPVLSSINSLNTLRLDSNAFEFGDIEPQIGITELSYRGQEQLKQGYDSAVNTSQSLMLEIITSGENNLYQWFKDGSSLDGETASTLSISNFGIQDVGEYYLEITNTVATEAVITSDNFKLYFDGPTADSIALVAIYDSLNGPEWTQQTNWKTAPLSEWYGIAVDSSMRVRTIDLSGNNLSGHLPPRVKDLTMLDTLLLGTNAITGDLPAEFKNMISLNIVDLSNNDLTEIPDNLKTSIPGLTSLAVENNRLEFGPLETNLAIANFSFIPQDSVISSKEVDAVIGGKAGFYAGVSGVNNSYQWYKNGTPIGVAVLDSLIINNIDFNDEGLYQVRIQNSLIGGLTLFTTNTRLKVLGLEADQQVLEEFYHTNGGENWEGITGWISDTIVNWSGVVIRNERVVEVNLPGTGVTGNLVGRFSDLTALEKLDLSDNSITDLPDLSTLSELTHLDVSGNKLQFAALERNIDIPGFIYNAQDSVGEVLIDTISVHENIVLSGMVSGNANQYQWFYNGTMLDGAVKDSFEIENISRLSMGKYYVQISNTNVPNLTLTSRIKTIMASGNIQGTVTDDNSNLITQGGNVVLLRITDEDGYDTTAVGEIASDGTYLLEEIVLDDYILIADADTIPYPDHLPTYFEQTIFWEEADTLKLVGNVEDLDMKIIIFEEIPLGGAGEITGYVEEEFNEEGGKLSARKRVASASVSVRRVDRAGRRLPLGKSRILEETTLAGHVKTNEEGRFAFTGLVDDIYYFNVQYPGYPMDSTSFIEIPVGDVEGGGPNSYHDKIEVEALVDKNQITVRKVNVTSIFESDVYSKIKIYPNPADDFITIDLSEYPGWFYIVLLDEQGRVIDHRTEVYGKTELDITTWSKGIYLMRIFNEHDKHISTQRLLIR